MDASLHHNDLVHSLLRQFIVPVYERGGGPAEVMVLLESVATGVILALSRLASSEGTPAQLADALALGVQLRLAADAIEPKGEPQ